MGMIIRDWRWSAAAVIALLVLIAWPVGCSQLQDAPSKPAESLQSESGIRVRILESKPEALLSAIQPPLVRTSSSRNPRRLNIPANTNVSIKLARSGWMIGNTNVGTGKLIIEPAAGSWLTVNDRPYRGSFHFVAVDGNQFDAVNHVGLDDYLYSVVPREMFALWEFEAYKAQAIIARTYALYEKKTQNPGLHWDVHTDTRSQVYGGVKDETDKSRFAVDQTAGIVVVHGSPGQEKIFKAYFSACCGGLSASAAEAFGDAWSEPLSEQNVGATCNISTNFNWGPIIVPKAELTNRFRAWGVSKNHPLKTIGPINDLRVAQNNSVGRPVRFEAKDAKGNRYSLRAEELRWAVNFNAPDVKTKLKSSFCRPVVQGDAVHFIDGHGHGHGAGMCQWCCQARALAGWKHERIVVQSYRGSKLARAY